MNNQHKKYCQLRSFLLRPVSIREEHVPPLVCIVEPVRSADVLHKHFILLLGSKCQIGSNHARQRPFWNRKVPVSVLFGNTQCPSASNGQLLSFTNTLTDEFPSRVRCTKRSSST